MNLLEETTLDIEESGHTIDDIVFIGSEESGHQCGWMEFKKLADREYDDGFGAPEVATDLIIVFSDGAKMWRHDYDGSERWDFSSPFNLPQTSKKIYGLFASGRGGGDLEEINN